MDRDDEQRPDVDPETGELRDEPPARRRRTPQEQEEARLVREVRARVRAEEIAAIRRMNHACETDADPPVRWRAPKRMGGTPNGVLLELPRASGSGLPGSRLVAAARTYDGAGPNGGEAHESLTTFIVYRDRNGYEWRTEGVKLRRVDGRAYVEAVIRWLDELDALDTTAAG